MSSIAAGAGVLLASRTMPKFVSSHGKSSAHSSPPDTLRC
jgi:hypothetical protein